MDQNKEYDIWIDDILPGVELSRPDFIKRLKEVHKVKEMKGTHALKMHMDGKDWFSYVWDWTIDGKRFQNHTRQLRRGFNKQMRADEE